MVAGERHLRGADEVHVVGLDAVDVLRGLAEEAGALHRARQHEARRDHRGEAVLDGLLHREVEQRELEQRAVALEVEEARARHLGAALDVDGTEQLAELEMVARLEALGGEVARRADLLEDGEVLLAADGGLEVDEVRHLQPELVEDVARPRWPRARRP